MTQLIRLRQVVEEPDNATYPPDTPGPTSSPTSTQIGASSVPWRDDTELRVPLARVMLLYAHARLCLSTANINPYTVASMLSFQSMTDWQSIFCTR